MTACLPLSLALLTALAPLQASTALVSSDFEGPAAPDGMVEGWAADSYSNWGGFDIQYARDADNPHSGAACQRITVSRIGYIDKLNQSWIGCGAAQVAAKAPLPVRKGGVYRVRAWLRAGQTCAVTVFLRQGPSPWKPYCEKTVVVGKDWQEVDYLATVGVDDPAAGFYARFGELGSLWLDDASVEELTPEEAREAAGPITSGNLLPNGDFDLARANWLGGMGWESVGDPQVEVEDTPDGPCLRLTPVDARGVATLSDAVAVTPTYPLQVSLRARASEATKVTFGGFVQAAEHAQWPVCMSTAEVGSEWQTVEVSGDMPFLPFGSFVFVRVTTEGSGTVWLDDVQVRQDGETTADPRPRAAIISDRHPWGLYHNGDEPQLRLLSTGADPVELTWRVEDYWGQEVLSGAWKPEAGRQEKRVSCADLPRGWYRATVSWEHAGRPYRNECTFCLLPPAERPGDPQQSPFGGHFMYGPCHLNLARSVGCRWLRLWPPNLTLWSTVEPEKGEWKWDDEAIRTIAREARIELFGMLESPPPWAKGDSPSYWTDWETYVATVVARYKDDVHVWEVQNEPSLRWWTSKPEGPSRADNHLEYLKHSYPVIKRVDPTATVVGGSVGGSFEKDTDGLSFTEELIDDGALEYMDALSFHYYHSYGYPRPMDEGEDPVADGVARIREKMRAAGKVVPIINSEGGIYNPGSALTYRPYAADNVEPISAGEAARLTARMYVSQWAAGVQRFFFYNLFIDGCTVTKCWDGFIEGDGQPRPAVAAYAVMTWLLDGAEFERTDHPTNDLWLHRFLTPRGPLVVAWARTGTTADLPLPDVERGWDLMGRELPLPGDGALRLDGTPVYLLLER